MWQVDPDKGRSSDGLTIKQREEIRRLRRENSQLRQERETCKSHGLVREPGVKRYPEPVVEPHFHDDSYGYRPGRSALNAVPGHVLCVDIL